MLTAGWRMRQEQRRLLAQIDELAVSISSIYLATAAGHAAGGAVENLHRSSVALGPRAPFLIPARR